jgi:TRAP-type C4-dicarboxylate transport system permease small subunit
MRELAGRIDAAVGRVERAMLTACQVAIAIMTISIFIEVVANYLFNSPTLWASEVSEYLMLFLGLMAAASASRNRRHINTGFFLEKFSEKARRILDLLFSVLTLFFASYITYKGIAMVVRAVKYDMTADTLLGTPLWIPYLIIPIGIGMLAVEALICVVKGVAHFKAVTGYQEGGIQ